MAKPYVIGIDMGGTNTVFGIVDARGTVIASDSIKTAKHSDFNDYIDELHTELTRIINLIRNEGYYYVEKSIMRCNVEYDPPDSSGVNPRSVNITILLNDGTELHFTNEHTLIQ